MSQRPDSSGLLQPTLVHTIEAVRECVRSARAQNRPIAFVPTMGALHAGHTSLIQAAKQSGAYVVVSIYVNPTQFGPNEDYQRYPRPMEADIAACRDSGVDLIFSPGDQEMYPPGNQTRVRPGALAEPMCGPFRPGHFEGVCTVVTKLFNIVQPDVAYFGQKDAQQALIIRRMVTDLRFPLRIEVCPIVRESDGLAMSSRNAMLSPGERQQALCLYRALCAARDLVRQGETRFDGMVAKMQAEIDKAAKAGPSPIRVDYLTIVDPETLAPAKIPQPRVMIVGAIRLGTTRLIDNLIVDLSPPKK